MGSKQLDNYKLNDAFASRLPVPDACFQYWYTVEAVGYVYDKLVIYSLNSQDPQFYGKLQSYVQFVYLLMNKPS